MLRHCDTQVSRTHHRRNEEEMLMSHWFAAGKIKPSHRQAREKDDEGRAVSHFVQNEVFFSQSARSRDPREFSPNAWINQYE